MSMDSPTPEPTSLDKARAAMAAAKDMDVELGSDKLPNAYNDLLVLARVQAEIAQAEALTRMADALADGRIVKRVIDALEQTQRTKVGW